MSHHDPQRHAALLHWRNLLTDSVLPVGATRQDTAHLTCTASIWADLQQRTRGQALAQRLMLLTVWQSCLQRHGLAGRAHMVVPARALLAEAHADSVVFTPLANTGAGFKGRLAALKQSLEAGLAYRDFDTTRLGEAAADGCRFAATVAFDDADVTAAFTAVVEAHFTCSDSGLRLDVTCRRDLGFSAAALGANFLTMLGQLVADPSRDPVSVPMWDDATRQRLIALSRGDDATPLTTATIYSVFARHAATLPQRPALIDATSSLSYAQCADLAEAVAARLQRDFGVGIGDKVAVLMPRSSQAVLAMLALFRLGAVYVPVDSHYPAGRRALIQSDADPVLTITASATDSPRHVTWSQLIAKPHARAEETEVGTEAIAYQLYTSGSTGRPKGVRIAHAGFCNTICHQIKALAVTSTDRCLAFAPLGFDAALAETFLALHAGAALVIVDEAVKDEPARFAAFLRTQAVSIATLPPAYQSVMNREDFAPLRALISAGEAPRRAVVAALADRLAFYNAYGPTETSVCAAMGRLNLADADCEPMPIGRPLDHSHVYVIDEQGYLVPPGAVGELAVAGIGVAAGYAERPEQTAAAFITQPETGQRIYRTGDLGRYRDDGRLAFHGRRDRQLKLRGIRIESGEIENALTQAGYADNLVMVAAEKLWAFALGSGDEAEVTRQLATTIPDYAMPQRLLFVAAWPMTAHGKIDRDTLLDLARASQTPSCPPATADEQLLFDLWRDVLGNAPAGVTHGFFHAGGDSIAALQITARLAERGRRLSVRDFYEAPTIRALATRLQQSDQIIGRAEVGDLVALTPIQKWFFQSGREPLHHFNQSVLLAADAPFDQNALRVAIAAIWRRHDQLRVRFELAPLRQIAGPLAPAPALEVRQVGDVTQLTEAEALKLQNRFDLAAGPLIRWVLLRDTRRERLLVSAHHLVMDGVSQRILLDDLVAVYRAVQAGRPVIDPPASSPFGAWSTWLENEGLPSERERRWWQAQTEAEVARLPGAGEALYRFARSAEHLCREDETRDLQGPIHAAYNTDLNDHLLAAFVQGLRQLTGGSHFKIAMEGHGRDESGRFDLSRTVGWFTSLFPVVVASEQATVAARLIHVKETLRAVPGKGLGFGALCFNADAPLHEPFPAEISFNFLGSFDSHRDGPFRVVREPLGALADPDARRPQRLDLIAWISAGRLNLQWTWHTADFTADQIEAALATMVAALQAQKAHCLAQGQTQPTPSDFTHRQLTATQVASLAREHDPVDLHPLTPMQQAVYFQSKWANDATYFEQTAYQLHGVVDVAACRAAVTALGQAQPVTRTRFVAVDEDTVTAVIARQGGPTFDHQHLGDDAPTKLEAFLAADRAERFQLDDAGLVRLTLLTFNDDQAWLVWSFHHILMDGWCLSILAKDFFEAYRAACQGETAQLTPPPQPRGWFAWLAERDQDAARAFWRDRLDGIAAPTSPVQRPSHNDDYRWNRHGRSLGASRTKALQQLAANLELSLFNVVQTLWALWTAKYTGSDEVVFGTVVSGRPSEVRDIEHMVGLFMNTVPVRVGFDADADLAETARRVAAQMHAAEAHHHLPLPEVLAQHPLGADLFDHLLIFENYPVSRRLDALLDAVGLRSGAWRSFEQTPYPLNLSFHPGDDLTLVFEVDENRFSAVEVARCFEGLCLLIDQWTTQPKLQPKAARIHAKAQILTGPPLQVGSVQTPAQRFAAQCRQKPDQPAVIDGDHGWTYAALSHEIVQLAGALRSAGVEAGDTVAVCVGRTYRMPLTFLAVSHIGAVFVPLDPSAPADRLQWIAGDCGARLLIVEDGVTVPAETATLNLDQAMPTQGECGPPVAAGAAPAYLVYTSGSTGRPKGVVVSQAALDHQTEAWFQAYDFAGSRPVALQLAGFAFDVFIGDVARTLAVGGTLVVVNEQDRLDATGLQQLLTQHKVTLFEGTPGLVLPLLRRLADQQASVPTLRLVIVGSDAWSVEDARVARRALPASCRLINSYGVTEATIDSCFFEISNLADLPDSGPVPIGRPLAGNRLAVLDQHENPLPPGALGELFIGGAAVAAGYHQRPDLSAARFREVAALGRAYATGDLARINEDGDLVFHGRADSQVKVRGYRIECGEIEAALGRCDGVTGACVVARPDQSQALTLVAYIVGAEAVLADLPIRLQACLPAYMVPARFIALPQLPLTPNGKVDRRALRARRDLMAGGAGRTPRNPTEETLWTCFAELLERDPDQGDIDLNFFAAGGHSLLVLRLLGRIHSRLGYDLSPRDVFSHPTVAALAEQLQPRQAQASLAPIQAVADAEHYPLSFSQRRLWILHQMEAAQAYNVPGAFTLAGPLDVAKLNEAVSHTVTRHQSLRTRFLRVGDEPRQAVVDQVPFALVTVDLSAESDPERAAAAHAHAEANRPFDLEQAPLFRATLLRLGDTRHWLLFTLHHIIADGWSMDLLFRDIGRAYLAACEDRPAPPAPRLQYRDYAVWSQDLLKGADGQRMHRYWRQVFAEQPAALNLPTDRPRPPMKSYRGGSVVVPMPHDLPRALETFCQKRGVTPFITLLCALNALLYRLSGQCDLVVGTPVAGRPHPDLDDQIGLFINSLALRTRFNDNTDFDSLLALTQQSTLDGLNHALYPFDRLVAELDYGHDPSRSPLYDVMLSYVAQPHRQAEQLGDLRIGTHESRFETAKLDLSFDFLQAPDGWTFSVEYNSDLYDPAGAAEMGRRLLRFVSHLCQAERPDHRTLTFVAEHELAVLQGPKPLPLAHTNVVAAFLAAAARVPSRIAVACDTQTLDFSTLTDEAARLARIVAEWPRFAPGKPVALAAPRDLHQPAAVLALWLAGAVYVPIDPEYPAERIQTMLRESGVRHVLADDNHVAGVQAPGRRVLTLSEWRDAATTAEPLPPRLPADDDLAYLMFTSGSTGVPKGVAVSHGNVAHTLLQACAGLAPSGNDDARFALIAGQAFDIAVLELMLPLTRGIGVEIFNRDDVLDSERRAAKLQRVSAFHAVPALLAQILETTNDLPNLRWVFTGGDRVPAELLRRAEASWPQAQVVALYGPTEATIICSALGFAEEKPAGDHTSIGRPLPGVTMSLRDRNGQIVPRGCLGEIHIAGPGVAAGYWRRGRLVAGRFGEDTPVYRSGDWARCDGDGLLHFAGRGDDQVKIRGVRIEPAEVENHLLAQDGVTSAVVAPRRDGVHTRLAAYLVTHGTISRDSLRQALARRLAEPMIPSLWFFLDALPRDSHGKIDRKALAALQPSEPCDSGNLKAPRNDIERRLAAIWCEVLKRDAVGIDQHFTEVGGHSLELTQVAVRMQEAFGYKPGMRSLILHPTIEQLAEQVARQRGSAQAATLQRAVDPRRFPATADQQRLWVLCQFEHASRAYHLPGTFRFRGRLDRDAFSQAFTALVERHPLLRARFLEVDEQLWVDLNHAVPALEIRDRHDQPSHLPALLDEHATRPFDLAKGPLVRATLIRIDTDDWVLALNLHHLIADAWSLNLLVADWWAFYQHALDHAPAPAPLAYQFADFAAERTAVRTRNGATDRAWWLEQLSPPPTPLEWVGDRPRPAEKGYRGAQPAFEIPAPLWNAVVATAANLTATPFAVLAAAVTAWARFRTGQHDMCFGTPVSGRDHEAWENVVGLFVDTAVVRSKVQDEGSFAGLVGQIAAAVNGARDHNAVGFAEIVDAVKPARDPSRTPLFDLWVSMFTGDETLPDGWSAEPSAYTGSQFDLAFQFARDGHRNMLYLDYDSDLFDAQTAATFAAEWQELLDAWTQDPGAPLGRAFACLQPAILTGRRVPPTVTHVLTRFEAVVHDQPEAVAFRHDTAHLTYAAWWHQSERVAATLCHNTRPRLVAVTLPRDLRLPVALTAVWRAGAAWLPLDPELPKARREMLLAQSGAELLLCCENTRPETCNIPIHDIDAALHSNAPFHPTTPSKGPAYVMPTSGSTGRPKCVVVEHAALANFLYAMADQPGLTAEDHVAAVTPISFDIAQLEFWLAPFVGASVSLFSREQVLADPGRINRAEVSLFQTTPANLALLLEAGWQPSPKLRLLCGGEALPAALAHQLAPKVAAFWNMYGPTETTIWSSCARLGGDEAAVHVGRPIDNTQIAVLDDQERPLPAGIRGHIAIAGAGLARGYLGQDDLTTAAFAAAPDWQTEQACYRTGDTGYVDRHGNLVVLGRRDFQIKHKGRRIEPGEIESALTAQPEISQAAVVLQGQAPKTLLCAFITAVPGHADADFSAVLNRLHALLPAALVPERLSCLDHLPLNQNGKIDRRVLAESTAPAPAPAAPLTAPQQRVAALWRAFGVEATGPDSHFFAAGGNSLKAVRLLNRLRELGTAAQLADVFRAPTLAAQATWLATTAEAVPLQRVADAEDYAASPVQTALWQHQRLLGNELSYLLPAVYRLSGKLDVPRLREALAAVVAAQESLRMRFHGEEQARFTIADQVQVPWHSRDLRALDAAAQTKAIAEVAADEASTPLPNQAPLMRVVLLRLGDEDWRLLVTLHHLIADAWSLVLLFKAWLTHYRDPEVKPTAPRWRYRDFAAQAQQRALNASSWWQDVYANPPAPLDLAPDRDSDFARDPRGASRHISLAPALVAACRDLATRQDATLFHLLAAVTTTFLHRYSGSEDLCIGTVFAGRNHSAWEDVIGLFVQSATLRFQPRGDASFTAYLDHVRDHLVSAVAHLDGFTPDRGPAPKVMLVLQEESDGRLELPDGLRLDAEELETGWAKYPLTLTFSPEGAGLRLSAGFGLALFDATTIEQRLQRFVDLLAQIVADPTQPLHAYRMLSPQRAEREAACRAHVAQLKRPDEALTARFDAVASRFGMRTALIDGARRLTYTDIDRLSARIAAFLVGEHGVGSGDRVGLCLPRSAEMVVALLGILRAGAAYVPIDPDYPAARRAFFAEDAGLRLCLDDGRREPMANGVTQVTYRDAVARQVSQPLPKRHVDSETYVIYTSGSTGTPKGVPIRDHQVAALLNAAAPAFQFDEDDVWSLFHSIAFDFSVWELFGALLHGAALVIVPREVTQDSRLFADLLRERRVTVLNQIPSAFAGLCAELDTEARRLPALRSVVFGGEALHPAKLVPFATRHPHCALVNMYGITETCVHVTLRKLDHAALHQGQSDIGEPLPHLHLALRGHHGEPVPDGATGEIYVAGLGVADGYLNRPDITAARFFTDAAGLRWYRSGDRARRDGGGRLIYQGRGDDQVKVRGYRIEIGEVEAALTRHAQVTEAFVRVLRDQDGHGRLCAWYVGSAEPDALRAALSQTLPDYMLPRPLQQVDSLPRTPSGKIDVNALPQGQTRSGATLQNDTERVLAELWRVVLNLADTPHRDSHFFELGGHSLNALRLCRRIEQNMARLASPRLLFEHPELGAMAAALSQQPAPPTRKPVTATVDSGALSPQQQNLWLMTQTRGLGAAYHVVAGFRLLGAVTEADIVLALQSLIDRHEALRSAVRVEAGLPRLHVAPEAKLPLEIVDAVCWEPTRQSAWQTAPFDLEQAPLLRALVIREEGESRQIWLCAHHLVIDGWSLELLQVEFFERLQGDCHRQPRQPEMPVRYRDVAALLQQAAADDAAYWRQALAEPPPPLQLPQDAPRDREAAVAAGRIASRLERDQVQALQSLARRLKISDFALHFGALSLTLARLSGQEHFAIGVPVAGRPALELERLVGYLVNTLPIACRLDPNENAAALLRRLHDETTRALEHQSFPFDQMVREHQPTVAEGRTPFFDVMLVLQNQDGLFQSEQGDLRVEALPATAGDAKFDLTWTLMPGAGGWWLDLEYRAALYSRERAERFMTAYLDTLAGLLSDCDSQVNHLLGTEKADDEMLFELEL